MIPGGTAWLTDAGAQTVCRVIASDGHAIYFVGGCVRNALLNAPTTDIDLATDATPEEVMALAKAAELKAVPTGIEHGTVTVIVRGIPYEVTTFRRDVRTDGRRAVVAFSTCLAEDARRRDLTINALYATAEGRVVDPLGGLEDLKARRIRFVGDPAARIGEDYLRILRYFRFHAWYGNPADGFDAQALSAIASNLPGLETLSAERVGAEMQKLLQAPDPAFALAGMAQTGVLGAVLPGSDARLIAPMVDFERRCDAAPDWRVRLAALGGDDPAQRLRLSKADARTLEAIRESAFGAQGLPEIAYRKGVAVAVASALLRAAVAEQAPDAAIFALIRDAAQAQMPVTADDLMPDLSGPALGQRLRQLEQIWIDSDFSLTREALLRLP